MPNFPPGSPNNVNVTPVVTLVFTPNPSAQSTVRFWNPGPGTAYVGGANVTPVNGLPILPGNRPVDLQNVNVNLYACSGFASATVSATVSSTAMTAGATGMTLGSGSVAAGTYLRVGNGTGVDFVQVSTVSTDGKTIATSTPFLYDHAASSTVATLIAVPAPLSVQAGVV